MNIAVMPTPKPIFQYFDGMPANVLYNSMLGIMGDCNCLFINILYPILI